MIRAVLWVVGLALSVLACAALWELATIVNWWMA